MSSWHSTRRRETAIVALVVALLLAPVGPILGSGYSTVAAQQDGAVLTVDDDGGANYTTISAAVGDASPNDTVRIRPGTYDESVTVDKNVTIVAPDGALVTGTFTIGAETRPVSPVIIGVTITPDTDGSDIGVATDDSTGDWELRNVVIKGSETDVGVHAGTSSGDWILRDVVLSNINDTRAISIEAVGSSGDWQLRNVTIRETRAGEAIAAFGSVGDWEAHNVSIVDFEETIATETAVAVETSEGDWALNDVRIEGGDVGVNAGATDGNWSITSAIFDGSDVGIDAGNAAGNWAVHHSSFTGNSEHSITAVDATRRGNATRNWWGQPEGPTADQCLGNVSCANPLTSPPGENGPPDAVAGADVAVRENSTVRLNGTASTDPDGDPGVYRTRRRS